MMHIILLILKIIGIFILCILGLILFILLLLLLSPLSYQIQGVYHKGLSPKGKAVIHYLFHMLGITIIYKEDGIRLRVKFLIFTVMRKKIAEGRGDAQAGRDGRPGERAQAGAASQTGEEESPGAASQTEEEDRLGAVSQAGEEESPGAVSQTGEENRPGAVSQAGADAGARDASNTTEKVEAGETISIAEDVYAPQVVLSQKTAAETETADDEITDVLSIIRNDAPSDKNLPVRTKESSEDEAAEVSDVLSIIREGRVSPVIKEEQALSDSEAETEIETETDSLSVPSAEKLKSSEETETDSVSEDTEYTGKDVFTDTEYTGKDVFTDAEYTGNGVLTDAEYTGKDVFTDAEYTGNDILTDAYKTTETDENDESVVMGDASSGVEDASHPASRVVETDYTEADPADSSEKEEENTDQEEDEEPGRLKKLWEQIRPYYELLQKPSMQKLLRRLKKRLFKIIRHILPSSLDIDMIAGFEDPAFMGKTMEAYAFLYALYGDHFRFSSDYENDRFDIRGTLKGYLIFGYILWQLLCSCVSVLLQKDCRKFILGHLFHKED